MYINNQKNYNSTGLCAQKSYISNNFEGAISEYTGVLRGERYDYEEFPEKFVEALLSEPFFTWKMKKLSRAGADVILLHGKLRVDFCSTSELLYANVSVRLRLIRARPQF